MKETRTFIKEFNEQRTPFFTSLLFTCIESIFPGIAIWFTIGNDFSFTLQNNLPNPIIGYVFLICFCYFLYTFISTFIFYKLKLHKQDNFTFSFVSCFVLIFITLIGYGFGNNAWKIIVKFILIFIIVVITTPFAAFLTVWFRNLENKKQEDFEQMYNAFKKGETIPTKQLLKVQRYEKYLLEKQKKEQELKEFKQQLDRKITLQLQEQEKLKLEKIQKINQKLDTKEEKKRNKDKQK